VKLSALDQVIVVLYLAAIMGIGLAMKRRAAQGMSAYFLGGRQLPWWALAICGLYVGTLYLILHRHTVAALCFAAVFVLGAALYFTWYKHLPSAARLETEPRATGAPAAAPSEISS